MSENTSLPVPRTRSAQNNDNAYFRRVSCENRSSEREIPYDAGVALSAVNEIWNNDLCLTGITIVGS